MMLAIPVMHILSYLNPKLRKGILGRRNWKDHVNSLNHIQVWFHLASLGEYEQALPVIRRMETEHGKSHIILSFFSPSGYEHVLDKNEHENLIYLPWDTWTNARYFIESLRPELVVFTKYDLWYHYLLYLEILDIPTLLISAYFDEKKYYFQWYGWWMKNRLKGLRHIFTQNKESCDIARRHGIEQVSLSGDTRIDRSIQLPQTPFEDRVLLDFAPDHHLLILGSTHEEDENMALPWLEQNLRNNWKVLIAPHDIDDKHISGIQSKLSKEVITYSKYENSPDHRFLILDQMGILKYLYRYADSVYVGGGFGSGIHNILEPLAYGVLLGIGPNYEHFPEATYLAQHGGLVTIESRSQWDQKFTAMFDLKRRDRMVQVQRQFLNRHSGADEKVSHWIKDNLGL